MADHSEIMQNIKQKKGVHYPALVPNEKGFEAALHAGAKDIAVFTAASETFSHKNTNSSISLSLKHIEKVIELAKQNNINVRGYVSCVIACPYEGPIKPQRVSDVAQALYRMGAQEISLGDTIGVGTPLLCQTMLETVAKHIPINKLAVHYHDTYGQALANIYASLQLGISIIDSCSCRPWWLPLCNRRHRGCCHRRRIIFIKWSWHSNGCGLNKNHYRKWHPIRLFTTPCKSKVALAMLGTQDLSCPRAWR